MESFLIVVFVLFVSTYVLARISSIAEQSKWDEIKKLRDEARKRHIDALYGRKEKGKDK